MSGTTLSEEEGIKAIIALQAFVGITETEEQARRGWRSMSQHAKEVTIATYVRLIEKPS